MVAKLVVLVSLVLVSSVDVLSEAVSVVEALLVYRAVLFSNELMTDSMSFLSLHEKNIP